MAAASELNRRGHGTTVTYSRKVFIPLTNLCRQKCGYCTFARGPHDPIAHTMTPDEVLAVARAGARQGCKEALFSLGERPEEIYDVVRDDLARYGHRTMSSYVREMCELVLRETGLQPHVNQGIMERDEIVSLREVSASMGMMLETTSMRLHERGRRTGTARGRFPRSGCARCASPARSASRGRRGSSSASARRGRSGSTRCWRSASCTSATATSRK